MPAQAQRTHSGKWVTQSLEGAVNCRNLCRLSRPADLRLAEIAACKVVFLWLFRLISCLAGGSAQVTMAAASSSPLVDVESSEGCCCSVAWLVAGTDDKTHAFQGLQVNMDGATGKIRMRHADLRL
eukprot:6127400-Alexandrium_andersonii.AAC.1